MSMDKCIKCGEFVDTDDNPEAYLIKAESIGLPSSKQEHECVCSQCQENMMQNMTDDEFERFLP